MAQRPAAWLIAVFTADKLRALHTQKLQMDRQEVFAEDIETGLRQQMMDVRDTAVQRIFYGNDANIGLAAAHRIDGIFKRRLRYGVAVRQRLACGLVAERTQLALERHRLRARNRRTHLCPNALRAFSRSAGVSTLSGTLSTRATTICMPASSARSCSSFSRFSRGDGGSATKRVNDSRWNA